ncbi:MAG: glycoside hydrolase family 43 protein [Candidatus Limnocylindrales bacterium]
MALRRSLLAVLVVAAIVVVGGFLLATRPDLRTAVGLVRSTTYDNPVLDRDFPDPAVLAEPVDGWWYAYATQSLTADGRDIDLQAARSRDLVTWEHLGDVLPTKPGWAASTQDFWAPHVVARDGRYVMYYSAAPDDGDGLCLAIATAVTPSGPFVDVGAPLECGRTFTDIDPMAFEDPADGRWWLFWGSGFEPIQARELAPGGLAFAPGSTPSVVLEPDPYLPYENLIEGAWVVAREGSYYLFYSGDSCCENPRYAVLVARSRALLGPYEKLVAPSESDSAAILEQDGPWQAPGHNSVVTDAAGQDWLLYHAIDRAERFGPNDSLVRKMLLDRVIWIDGWPAVERGVASDGSRAGPIVP